MRGIVVGAGFMGKTHLEAYARRENARIVAVVDGNLEAAKAARDAYTTRIRAQAQAQEARGAGSAANSGFAAAATADNGDGGGDEGAVAAHSTLEQALAASTRADFVDVCLPSPLHRGAVVASLHSGCDVLVEKPFALDLEDADAMIEAAARSGRRLMVAHVCRFMPQYRALKRAVGEGELGRPLHFSAWRLSETPAWSWQGWITDESKSGGTLLDLSIHDLDVANWLFGVPGSFCMHEARSKTRRGPCHVVSTLGYADGVRAVVEAGHLMPVGYPFTAGFRLVAEGGTLEWGAPGTPEGVLVRTVPGHRDETPAAELGFDLPADPYEAEIRHFLSCLESGSPFDITPAEARLAVETVLRLRAATAEDRIGRT